MGLPPLRYIDPVRIDHEGDTYIVIRDPEGYVQDELMLSAPAFFIAAHLDGANGIAEIQDAFEARYGVRVQEHEIQSVVDHLDQGGYLVSAPFLAMKSAVDEGFRNQAVRPAYLAGTSYPADPAELRAFIDEFFTRVGGPNELPGPQPADGPCLSCLVAPHIDFGRGGHTYAHSYLHLFRHGPPATVLLFGVAHCGVPAPFVLTRKDFATPLGTLPANVPMVDRLAAVSDGDPFAYEIVHRTEHSLEFQAVMLAYLYGPSVSIVPILCSSFSNDPECDNPQLLDSVARFLAECRAIVAEAPGAIAVIAAADLAHVGTRFGDAFAIDDDIVRHVAERDGEALAHAVAMRPEDFYRSIMSDRNERRVCGLNCIYSALKSVEGTAGPGAILHYDYAHDPAGGIVSFAAGAFPPSTRSTSD